MLSQLRNDLIKIRKIKEILKKINVNYWKNTDNRGFPLKVFTSYKESVSFLGIRKTAADKNENNRMICKQWISVGLKKWDQRAGKSDVHRIRRKKRDDKMTSRNKTGSRFDRNYGSACRGLLRSSGFKAKQNFPITGTKLHPVFIRNLAQIKKQQLSLIIMQGFFREG